MPRRNQLRSEQACPAPQLEDEPAPGVYRGEKFQDPGSAGSGVEAESAVMHFSEIAPVNDFGSAHLESLHARLSGCQPS